MNIKQTVTDALQDVSSIKQEVKELATIRGELLRVEATEYTAHLKKKVAELVGLLLTGFFFLCVLIVSAIGALGTWIKGFLPTEWQDYSWQLVAISVSLIFLLVVLILLAKLKKKPADRFFSHSLQELQNDSVWLKTLTDKEKKS